MPRICGRYVSDELYEQAQDAARDAEIEQQEREAEDDEEPQEDEPLSADNFK